MNEDFKTFAELEYTWSSPTTFNLGQMRIDFNHSDPGYPPLCLESIDDGISWTIFRAGERIFHGPIPKREELLELLDILTI